MVSRRGSAIALAGLALLVLLPGSASAQSAIAGVVKDATGAVLPGVTVEASSPALIEQVKTVTTDAAGLYRVIDLRPGSYVVTFTLPGFNVVKRDGIELPSDFTATVNVELKVGAVEETVTVTGASPVVDIKSATVGQVLTRELLDAVPTGRSIWALGSTLTGVTLSAPDVGGTAGMQQTYMAVHGSQRQDNAIQVDGMSVNGIEGDGAIQNYFNEGMFQEMSYQTSAISADVQSSGVRLNMIPKEGANVFKGSLFLSRTPGQWQSNNFTDDLRAKGLQAPNRVERIQDLNPGFGGPIVKNRLWFFGSYRHWGVDQTITDSFYNLDTTHKTYVIANGLNGRP
ncbi:MAG: carboxypeptidase regulatory-like domain-containing protein, partial [Acidobacteria bacterium]|nr:carboxypeptidase regulatory-like domain-containing protein [Acidobacteriota bacterium]